MALSFSSLIYYSGTSNDTVIAVINPVGSGVKCRVLGINIVSLANVSEFELKRWDGIPTASGGVVSASVFKADSAQAAGWCEVKSDPAFDFTGLNVTWQNDSNTLLSDAGDDTTLLFYVPDSCKPVINAGEALTITLPTGVADYDFNIHFEEF